jgi:hypothetical protein
MPELILIKEERTMLKIKVQVMEIIEPIYKANSFNELNRVYDEVNARINEGINGMRLAGCWDEDEINEVEDYAVCHMDSAHQSRAMVLAIRRENYIF